MPWNKRFAINKHWKKCWSSGIEKTWAEIIGWSFLLLLPHRRSTKKLVYYSRHVSCVHMSMLDGWSLISLPKIIWPSIEMSSSWGLTTKEPSQYVLQSARMDGTNNPQILWVLSRCWFCPAKIPYLGCRFWGLLPYSNPVHTAAWRKNRRKGMALNQLRLLW